MRSRSGPLWLFDLDNTLHDASHAIFPAINANMNAFIAQALGTATAPADPALVNALRIDYWQRYGATLLGMVKHHAVRPADFLSAAHRFDDVHSMIRAERGLAQLFRRLPGRKILLTNAPRQYSRLVLRHLGLHRHFAAHVPIESMRVHGKLRPKPSGLMLRQLMARQRVRPGHCILVEDTAVTLKTARALGMRTAWVTQYLRTPQRRTRAAYIDVKVSSVRQLPAQLHRLRCF